MGDSSTDSIPNDDVQLKLNEAYAHASCLGTNLPTQVEVDTADAARHVKVLADDDASCRAAHWVKVGIAAAIALRLLLSL